MHWRQIGNVIDRPSQLDFSKLGVSRGVFAPSIEYRDGTVLRVQHAVDGGGNYVVTAKNPAGPWSDPVWLPELDGGIDPSMFVDDDGRAYVLNNGPPEGTPRYSGHRAIWIQEFDRGDAASCKARAKCWSTAASSRARSRSGSKGRTSIRGQAGTT